MDYKGVFMPDIDELLLGKSPKVIKESTGNDKTKNTHSDVDVEWYSLPYFIKMACEGETIALDMLHTHTNPDMILEWNPEWQYIVDNKHLFYTKNMKAFLGYARKQASKYGIKGSRMGALEEVYDFIKGQAILRVKRNKLEEIWSHLPINEYCYFVEHILSSGEIQIFYEVLGSKYQNTMPYDQFVLSIEDKWSKYGERARAAKENEGVDWKAVSHAVRAAYQLKEIYEEGNITYPLKQRGLILDIKQGKLDFTTVVGPLLEDLISQVEILAEKAQYPAKIDRRIWDEFLLRVYKKEGNGNTARSN
jgi:hypothetical protein